MPTRCRYTIFSFVFCLIACAVHPVSVAAQDVGVILTELYPAPATGESEWVELFNSASTSANLAGWSLTDELTTPSTIYTFSQTEPPLGPGEFRQVITTANKLNNTGDSVTLYSSDGVQASQLVYTSSQSGMSQQRVSLGSTATATTTGTPGADNSLYSVLANAIPPPTTSPTPSPTPTLSPTPTPLPTAVAINSISVTEIMACPASGQTEWVELYNAGGAATLSNWRITDQSGNFRTLEGTLATNSYTAFTWTGSLLNNAGDGFVITTDTGQSIDAASYEECETGKSLIRSSEQEWVSAVPSPGLANPSMTAGNETAGVIGTVMPSPSPSPLHTFKSGQVLASSTEVSVPRLDLTALYSRNIASTSGITQPEATHPAVLGEYYPRTPSRPWWVLFVIISGVLLTTAGLIPTYAPTH